MLDENNYCDEILEIGEFVTKKSILLSNKIISAKRFHLISEVIKILNSEFSILNY
jgi:hypothetical protein